MLKYNEVNPLNVHDLRQINFVPPHFKKITINQEELQHLDSPRKVITSWIYENLSGRFCIISNTFNHDTITIGFEEHSEASFFILSLSTIHNYK